MVERDHRSYELAQNLREGSQTLSEALLDIRAKISRRCIKDAVKKRALVTENAEEQRSLSKELFSIVS